MPRTPLKTAHEHMVLRFSQSSYPRLMWRPPDQMLGYQARLDQWCARVWDLNLGGLGA
jgi:hypothetical protein